VVANPQNFLSTKIFKIYWFPVRESNLSIMSRHRNVRTMNYDEGIYPTIYLEKKSVII